MNILALSAYISLKVTSNLQFQHFVEPVLDHFTGSRLFDWIEGPLPGHKPHHDRRHYSHHHPSHHSTGNPVHLHHFASHLAILLKGHVSELSSVCLFLASTSPSSVSASDLVHVGLHINL